MNNKIFDITPKRFKCVVGACPSIFKTNKETYIIIGKKLNNNDLDNKIKNKIGEEEIAVEVPKGLIDDLNK